MREVLASLDGVEVCRDSGTGLLFGSARDARRGCLVLDVEESLIFEFEVRSPVSVLSVLHDTAGVESHFVKVVYGRAGESVTLYDHVAAHRGLLLLIQDLIASLGR